MRCNRLQLSVIQLISVCVSHDLCSVSLIYCCLSSYNHPATYKAPVCLKPRPRQIRVKAGHVTDCVFLLANATSRTGIHTVCAWSAWERSTQSRLSRGPTARIASGFPCIRFAPGRLSLRREPSPAFLTVLAPLPPRRSGSCTRGVRSWIW